MKKIFACALLLGLAPLVASSCAGPTCSSGDVACYLDHMVIAEPVNEGRSLELTRVLSDLLPLASDTGPSILGPILPIAYATPSELQPISLPWSDPEGCDPAMCFQLCTDLEGCSADFACAPPLGSGSPWLAYVGFLAPPRFDNERLHVVIVPVTAEGCASDVITRITTGDPTVRVGVARSTEIMLGQSNRDIDGSCSNVQPVCGCSLRACSEGECWYETESGGRIECANGCDCSARLDTILTTCCVTP